MSILRQPEERAGLSSDIVIVGETIYITVVPTDEHNDIVGHDIRSQAWQCFLLLSRALRSVGADLHTIAHLTIYLTDIQTDRAGFNEVYEQVFDGLPVPVRCAVGVQALARPGFYVELTAIATKSDTPAPDRRQIPPPW